MRRSTASRTIAALVFGLLACGESPDGDADRRVERDPAADPAYDADDTGRNARDRGGRTLTPTDQSNAESDLKITQQIRQKITEKDQLSTDAENVKIVTDAGVVTLRGPVENEVEKRTIVELARNTEGVMRVDDQLEVSNQ